MIIDFEELPDFFREYLSYLSLVKDKSQNTIDGYYYDLTIFFRWCKKRMGYVSKNMRLTELSIYDFSIELLKKLTLNDLKDFIKFSQITLKNGEPARARKVASLKSFFKYLNVYKNDQFPNQLALGLESPKLKKSLPKYLSKTQSQELLSAIDYYKEFAIRDFAILCLFLGCGLKLSELCNINISNINYNENSISILSKGSKKHIVYMNTECSMAVKDYIHSLRPKYNAYDSDALFLSKFNKRISPDAVQLAIRNSIRDAGLDTYKYSPHKLRHTYATLLYQTGEVSVFTLKELLGYEDIRSTQLYLYLDDKEKKIAANKVPIDFRKDS